MMGTGSPGGTEQMAAVRCDFLGCAVMVAMGVHYKAEGRKVSPSSTAWRELLTPFSGRCSVCPPGGYYPATSIT
jgi:hypothetical protein